MQERPYDPVIINYVRDINNGITAYKELGDYLADKIVAELKERDIPLSTFSSMMGYSNYYLHVALKRRQTRILLRFYYSLWSDRPLRPKKTPIHERGFINEYIEHTTL